MATDRLVIKLINDEIIKVKRDIYNLKFSSDSPEVLAYVYDYLTHRLKELELEQSVLN